MQTPFIPTNIPIREEKLQVAAIMPLRFWTEYHNVNVAKPGEPEMLEQKSYEWVQWAKKGVSIPATGADKVVRVRKDPELWAAIEPAYNNWKAGGSDELINGTPLNAWGGITRDEVEALKPFRIYSVEDFAGMNDGVMQRIPFPHIAAKRDRAKKWLSSKETADEVRGQLSEVIESNKKLMAELEAMRTKETAAKQIAEIRADSKPKGTKTKNEVSA